MEMKSASIFRLRQRSFISFLTSLLVICLLLFTAKYSIFIERLEATEHLEDVHIFPRYNIDCSAIYDLDPIEVGKSLTLRKKRIMEEDDESLMNLTSNCPRYRRSGGYGALQVSEEEQDFPLAYSLVVHKSAWMVEAIVRSLYSPNNIYCIHYDKKSSAQFIAAIKGLARCLPNVFIASKLETVYYASINRLNADLNCLSDLLRSQVKWRYAINLCGQDFPLKTNRELVAELRNLNGANMMETCNPSNLKKQRFGFHHEMRDTVAAFVKLPVKTNRVKDPPPHGIQMFIGSAYFVLSRKFVAYVNTSTVAKDFLEWSEDTYSPDEHFWATLTRVPGVPGEVPRSQGDVTDLMSKTRLVKWVYLEEVLYPPCTGTHVRSVCIYGAAELRWLLDYGHWFANKLEPDVDSVLIQCLQEKLRGRSPSQSRNKK